MTFKNKGSENRLPYWGITNSNDDAIKSNPSTEVRPLAIIETRVSSGTDTSDDAVTVINGKSSPSVTLPGLTLNLITGSVPNSWAKAEEPAIRAKRPTTAKEARSNLPNIEAVNLVIIRHVGWIIAQGDRGNGGCDLGGGGKRKATPTRDQNGLGAERGHRAMDASIIAP